MKYSRNNPQTELDFLQDLLRQAGQMGIERQVQQGFQLKPDHSIVTSVDKDIETFLIDKISEMYPDHRIISEERGVIQRKGKYTWAIDPIDGTRVYYGGLPMWGISIGLLLHHSPLLGVFYLPKLDEMYVGAKRNAYLNGEKLSSVGPSDIDGPTAFLAVPSQCHRLFEVGIKRLRSFGSLAVHLAYVARGVAVGALTQHASIWDIAAMLPILKAVGVEAKYLSGEELILSDLLTSATTKPLVFAQSSIIDHIRDRITVKQGSRSIVD